MSKKLLMLALLTALSFNIYGRNHHVNNEFIDNIKQNNITRVKMLLNKNVNINLKDKYSLTPLHYAASFGCIEIVKMLLAKRTCINVQDKHGNTPLYYAVFQGYTAIVKELLSKGANPYIKNNKNETAATEAFRFFKDDFVITKEIRQIRTLINLTQVK